jgi:3-hydroxyacyl-[acyl-carrier-protein] dehydratase
MMDGTQPDPASTTPPGGKTIDIAGIMHAIPHRFPFLLIDRVTDLHPDRSAIGVKNVSINEHFFDGHFPGHPVMPGVLIIEAMAQTAAVLVVETLGPDEAGKVVYFMSVESAKFRRPVIPGDSLRIHVEKQRNRGPVWRFAGVAKVGGVTVAEAVFAAMITDLKAEAR